MSILQEIRNGQNTVRKVWLSPDNAALYLGVSVTRIYQYIRADGIPFHRLPDSNLVRIHVDELDEWVRKSEKSTRGAAMEALRRL
jgi:excisionase family DNA binding protein